ncbi:FkbM family methyltransferase [Ectocarpus siliculosus]|uniref:FkbM family methyltransferase n=1 Tax=Ectocarpus siliculosus TaxID=2880 RepID=D7FYM2_ECTSI|nr:FkbM family methyltransferase [Ectocarpus siliculosus]|eukprot:CBJ32564.1 FkbM family methyltransferase [Ectocarpus siliculosus]
MHHIHLHAWDSTGCFCAMHQYRFDPISSAPNNDASLVSFGSEEPTPTKHHYVPRSPRDDAYSNTARPWRPVGWSRVVDTSVPTAVVDNPEAGLGGREVADVTTRIYSSSSSCATERSTERVARHQGKRHHRHTDSAADHERRTDRRRRHRHPTPDRDHETASTVALLTNELVIVRSQIEQKDVVVRSLQRQLDQRGELEAQTQARAEEDLVAALAKASGLKEELTRTSQLLVDGALARQHLEQRCSVLTEELQKTATRTTELENEVAVSRAEVVRISGALHARRSTDVVDAERAFGEELQRVQESAARETRTLGQEASGLRTLLEQTKSKLRNACGERDSWREEADSFSSEAATLRETVQALRQYSENDTIDQLLGQVSRWKRRAEELENLQRVASSPERSAFDGSSSETEPSRCTESVEPLPSPTMEGGPPLAAEAIPTTVFQEEKEEHEKVLGDGHEAEIHSLRQELSEAKKSLVMKGEEVAAAVLEARQQAAMRAAAESCVEGLQRKAEANARAAREHVVARRAAKARDMANLKIAIQQDMVDELHKLQCEVRKQRQEEQQLHGTTDTGLSECSGERSREPVGLDKACQSDNTIASIASSSTEEGVVVESNILNKVGAACPACGVDLADSGADGSSIVASPKVTVVLEDEAERRVSAALASAAVAQVGATAWASAFSAARRLFHTALVSLCEQADCLFGADAKGNGRQALVLSPLVGLTTALRNEASSAMVPWAPSEAEADAAAAMEVLRDDVESSMERFRSALADHLVRTAPLSLTLTMATVGSQTTAEPPTDSTTAVSRTTTGSLTTAKATLPRATSGSQTDEVGIVELKVDQRHNVGVQAGNLGGWRTETAPGAGGRGGAPAWEGGMDSRCSEGEKYDGDRSWRPKSEDHARMEELELKAGALSAALQRAEKEKSNLERSLTRRFKREKAMQLKKQRDKYEADIGALHVSTMALLQDFPINTAA